MPNQKVISVVDDDESVRESLPDLLRQFGFAAEAFSSAEEFLAFDRIGKTAVLILDVALPGMSGPELHRELVRRHKSVPVVFITAHETESARLRAMTQPDVQVLFKPFGDMALLGAINTALKSA